MPIFFVWDKHLQKKNPSYNKELLAMPYSNMRLSNPRNRKHSGLQKKKYELNKVWYDYEARRFTGVSQSHCLIVKQKTRMG